MQIGIYHQNCGCIIVHIPYNHRHGVFASKLRSMVAAMSSDYLISTFRTGTGDCWSHNTKLCDTFDSFLHGFIIQHFEGVSLKRVEFRKRNFLHSFLLSFLS